MQNKSSPTPSILICDDDQTFHLAARQVFKGSFEVKSAYHGDEALVILRKNCIQAILLDVQMRESDEGLRFLPKFLEVDPEIAIIMSSGLTDFETVKQAMKLGAVDFVPKDFDPNELVHTVKSALERQKLIQNKRQASFETGIQQKKFTMIGESPEIESLRKKIGKMQNSNANVLIHGDTGTGKELVARQFRTLLPDGSWTPFIAVDSATIQSSTAESQLFGHEKGSFTGADRAARGIFEEANGGVVYFDEIANMSLEIQAKLLRVLQEKEVVRMGSSKSIPLDFRVIAATNRDLEQMVKQGQFKDDLLQRINVLPLQLPALRERQSDIPLLIDHFCSIQARGLAKKKFSNEAVQCLTSYDWPGNVRELSNVVTYVLTMSDEPVIELSDLPPRFRDIAQKTAVATRSTSDETSADGFYARVSQFETEILSREYERLGGNITKMALQLQMDRSHLYSKLKERGIHAPRQS